MRAFAATGMLIAALALFAVSCGDSEPAALNTPPPETATAAATPVPAPPETATAAATPVPAPPETATAAATPVPAPPETATAAATPAPESDLPSVDLIDVATGATVNLASFAPSDRPIMLWFWAPH